MKGAYVGYVFGFIAAGALIWIALDEPEAAKFNTLLLVSGGLIGWIAGILITPEHLQEKEQFSSYIKIIGTFLTGYLVAKLDNLYSISVDGPDFSANAFFFSSLIFLSAFSLGVLFTFVWRSYVETHTRLIPPASSTASQQPKDN